LPYEFYLAREGYFDRVEDTEAAMRNLAIIVNRSMGGDARIENVWTLRRDPKPERIKPLKQAELQDILNKHKEVFKD
jgi:hypothetical protein